MAACTGAARRTWPRAEAVRVAQSFTARRPSGELDSDSMSKQPSTDVTGKPFDAATIEAVWNKAPISSDHSPLRLDPYGALIWRGGYGNTNSKLGWEIGYRTSPGRGGSDDLGNLQPLQWENYRQNGHS